MNTTVVWVENQNFGSTSKEAFERMVDDSQLIYFCKEMQKIRESFLMKTSIEKWLNLFKS
jgi:hypothetical protein